MTESKELIITKSDGVIWHLIYRNDEKLIIRQITRNFHGEDVDVVINFSAHEMYKFMQIIYDDL